MRRFLRGLFGKTRKESSGETAIGPRPGPQWRPYRVVVRELSHHVAVVHGWSPEQVERKAWRLYVRRQELPTTMCTEIIELDMEVEETS